MIKIISALCLFYIVLPTSLSAQGGETLVDRVVAIVDARPLFYSDIKRKIEVGPLVIVSEHPSTKDSPPEQRALNDAINFELILSSAKDLDIEVPDGDLDQEITHYLEEQKLSKEKLIELLKAEGETFERYRSDFRNQLTLRRFQRKVIAPSIKVTDKDVETYFLSQTNSGGADLVEISLRQITIKIDPSLPSDLQESKKQRAQEVYNKLKNGLNFSEAIGLYSDDERKSADSPGLRVKVKELAPKIRDAVEQLKSGEYSPPIQIGSSIFIFQVSEKKLSISKEFSDKKPQLEQELRLQELRNQTNKWLSDQRQRVTVKLIAE